MCNRGKAVAVRTSQHNHFVLLSSSFSTLPSRTFHVLPFLISTLPTHHTVTSIRTSASESLLGQTNTAADEFFFQLIYPSPIQRSDNISPPTMPSLTTLITALVLATPTFTAPSGNLDTRDTTDALLCLYLTNGVNWEGEGQNLCQVAGRCCELSLPSSSHPLSHPHSQSSQVNISR